MRFFISWPTYLLFSIHARLVHIVRAKSIFLNYYKKKHSCQSLQHLVQNKNLNLKIICFKLLTPFVFSTIRKTILFQGQRKRHCFCIALPCLSLGTYYTICGEIEGLRRPWSKILESSIWSSLSIERGEKQINQKLIIRSDSKGNICNYHFEAFKVGWLF